MKAVIYARVSTKEQEREGFSIPAQLKLLTEYALKNNYTVVKEFKDAETAKFEGRENFNLMLKYLKENADIKVIICEKTDRISRNFKDMATIEDMVENQKYTIIFVKENNIISKRSKSQGKLMFYIMASMARNYVNNLSEETRKGMLEKANSGTFPSYAPFGYINYEEKTNGRHLRQLKPDENRAPIIHKVFKMYSTGDYSLEGIVEVAYEEGLRTRKSLKVNKSAIYSMLQNPIYYGSFRWNGKLYPGSHTPIISKELFDAVQSVFSSYNKPKQTARKFAYTGLLTCDKCGCSITAEIKKNKYVYYHCTSYRGKCGNTYIREEELSDKLANMVKNIHISDDILELVKQALLENHTDERLYYEKKVNALARQKGMLEHRLHEIYVDKLDRKLSQEKYDSMLEDWTKELDKIKGEIARHEKADINYLSQGTYILELCNKAHGLYLRQNAYERAKLLHTILSNCTLNDGSLCPTYRKPFDIIAKGPSRSDWLPGLDSNQRPNG